MAPSPGSSCQEYVAWYGTHGAPAIADEFETRMIWVVVGADIVRATSRVAVFRRPPATETPKMRGVTVRGCEDLPSSPRSFTAAILYEYS